MTQTMPRTVRHLTLVPDAPRITEKHPDWCDSGVLCGDIHIGPSTPIPATAGGFRIENDAASFPLVEVYAQLDHDTPTVAAILRSPLAADVPHTRDWMSVEMPPDVARALIAAVFNAVCGDGSGEVEAGSPYGPVTVAVSPDDGDMRLALARDGVTLSASLRLAEARKFADAVGVAIDVVTAPVVWVDETLVVGRF